MPTCICTRVRLHLCVNQGIGGGGEVITANTYKSPIQTSSLRTVPLCDKPAAYRCLENIKLSSLWQGHLKKELRESRGLNQAGAQIICCWRAAAVTGTPSDGRGNEKMKDVEASGGLRPFCSLIPPFECKAVVDLIVGLQLQRQSHIRWRRSGTRSRGQNTGVVEVAKRHTYTLAPWFNSWCWPWVVVYTSADWILCLLSCITELYQTSIIYEYKYQ